MWAQEGGGRLQLRFFVGEEFSEVRDVCWNSSKQEAQAATKHQPTGGKHNRV